MGLNPSYAPMRALCFCLVLWPAGTWADLSAPPLATSPDISSLEAGIVCPPETIGSVPAPGTVAGTTHVIAAEPPFVSNIRRVPAVLGIGFGVKSQTSIDAGLEGVLMVVSHPPMGHSNAETQSFTTRISDVDASLTFYQFDYDYELVPGTWHMTAMHGQKVLYDVAFEVVPPKDLPELAEACGYQDELLS